MKQSRQVNQLNLFDEPKRTQPNVKTQNRITTIKEEKLQPPFNRSKTKNIFRPKTGKKNLILFKPQNQKIKSKFTKKIMKMKNSKYRKNI